MPRKDDKRVMPGSICATCKQGWLELSPSGSYLICPKCGNAYVVPGSKNEAGEACPTCGQGILEQSPAAKYLKNRDQ